MSNSPRKKRIKYWRRMNRTHRYGVVRVEPDPVDGMPVAIFGWIPRENDRYFGIVSLYPSEVRDSIAALPMNLQDYFPV